MKYKIWDKVEDLVTPIGTIQTPEQVFAECPYARVGKYIICNDEINKAVFMPFSQTKEIYRNMIEERKLHHPGCTCPSITDDMTDQEVCDAISHFETEHLIPEPTASERIAAAMEFQNILAL